MGEKLREQMIIAEAERGVIAVSVDFALKAYEKGLGDIPSVEEINQRIRARHGNENMSGDQMYLAVDRALIENLGKWNEFEAMVKAEEEEKP